jgi:hypothetical protein
MQIVFQTKHGVTLVLRVTPASDLEINRLFRRFIESLQILARLEANCPAGLNVDFGPSPRIAADSCLSRLYGEDSKATKFNPLTMGEGFLHTLQNFFHGLFGSCPRQTRSVDYPLDQILLDHAAVPSGFFRPCKWGGFVRW